MLSQPKARKKLSLLILLSAAAFVFFPPSTAHLEGGKLKDFTLMDMDGNQVRLFEFVKDKPLFLYFWASWCKPCRLVTPKVAALAKDYSDRITVIGINVGGVDSPKVVKKYVKSHHIDYPVLIDSDNGTLEAYSIHAIPTIILLDKNGTILFRDNEPPENLEKLLPK
jgi:thiol-disulfide isomerase/thioredoxin